MISSREAAEIARLAITRRELTAALVQRGYPPDGPERKAVKAIQELRRLRAETRRGIDPLILACKYRASRLAWLRESRKHHEQIQALLSLPIAAHWRSDRKTKIAQCYGLELAFDWAVDATLEAVTRLATSRWGFIRTHTSKSHSRYLKYPNGRKVRISDHYIPRYGDYGQSLWPEVVIGWNELQWTPEDWHKELRELVGADEADELEGSMAGPGEKGV